MTQRRHAIEVLSVYFDKKGRILTSHEYKLETDAPIRFTRVKQIFGGWNRMENIVRTFNGRNQKPEDHVPSTDVDNVLRAQSDARREYEDKMKAASENVDAKTAREEAAKQYIEADKLRAATAEGALENKLRKGGVTDQDAKVKKEAIEQAVAEEHAMLAMTPQGAALGKYLLGGVEDNDEKVRVIAEQNAFTERTKLMAATPLGAAEAKLVEDDTDGKLTREAQARINNELRPYVPPEKDGSVERAHTDALKKVRSEIRSVVALAAGNENVDTGAADKASAARRSEHPSNDIELSPELIATMPPADRPPEPGFVDKITFTDAEGHDLGYEIGDGEPAKRKDNPKPPADQDPEPVEAPIPQAHKTEKTNEQKAEAHKTAAKEAPKVEAPKKVEVPKTQVHDHSTKETVKPADKPAAK